MKISLIGYMGSGKTTIAQHLARQLNVPFYDLDRYLEEKENQSISFIFKNQSELYFRKKENQYLQEILQNPQFILATGGGTPCYYNNMSWLNQHTKTIFLQLAPTQLAQRLWPEKHLRPLIAHLTEEQLTEFIAKHLFERNQFYQQANIIINANRKTQDEIVTEILNKIKPQNHQNHS